MTGKALRQLGACWGVALAALAAAAGCHDAGVSDAGAAGDGGDAPGQTGDGAGAGDGAAGADGRAPDAIEPACRELGPGNADDVAFSPDGARLALGTALGVEVAEVAGGRRLWRASPGAVRLAWAPDGNSLAGSNDYGARLWRAADGALLRSFDDQRRVGGVRPAFSPDGAWLALGGSEARVFRAADGTMLWSHADAGTDAGALAFTLDGAALVVVSLGVDRVWTARSFAASGGAPERTIASGDPFADMPESFVALAPDATLLLGSGPTGLVLHSGGDGAVLRVLGDRLAAPRALFSRDGQTVAAVDDDGRAHLYATSDGTERAVVDVDQAYGGALGVSDDGALLATGDTAGVTTSVWRAADGARLLRLGAHDGGIHALAIAPDDTLVASGGDDGLVKLWDAVSGAEAHALAGHAGPVTALAFAADGRTLASAGSDGTVRLWTVSDGSMLRALAQGAPVRAVAFAPGDGGALAAGDGAGHVVLWNAADGGRGRDLAIGSAVVGLAFTPDGGLVVGDADAGVRFFRDGDAPVWTADHGAALLSVAATGAAAGDGASDNALVASASWYSIKLWHAADGTAAGEALPGSAAVVAVAFSADARRVLAAGRDLSTFLLPDLAPGPRFIGRGSALALAVGPSGRLAATAGYGIQVYCGP